MAEKEMSEIRHQTRNEMLDDLLRRFYEETLASLEGKDHTEAWNILDKTIVAFSFAAKKENNDD